MKLKNIIKTIKSIRYPLLFRRYIFYKIISLLYRDNKGDYIFDEKWDNLIILDACRYDFFEKIFKKYRLKGILEKKLSRGAHTTSFLTENFKEDYYKDLIYVTASPFVDILIRDKIFKVISVWREEWSEKYHTVLPENIYKNTIRALKKFPNKKLIIHFMQPHYPYIGYNIKIDSLDRLRESALKNRSNITTDLTKNKFKEKFSTLYSSPIYAMVDIATHIKGYWKNLEIVLPYIIKLLEILPGQTIITSDHGEAFGELIHPLLPIKFYGHRKGVRMPILINVPWFKVKQEIDDLLAKRSLLEKEIISDKVKYLKNLEIF